MVDLLRHEPNSRVILQELVGLNLAMDNKHSRFFQLLQDKQLPLALGRFLH